jgi:predicted nuclease of predicted toxin-antitoxin system
LLSRSGHDAVHVSDLGAAGATDAELIDLAAADERVIVSADTDFGALLAHTRASKPSVILVRALVDRPPELVGIVVANLHTVRQHLQAGPWNRRYRRYSRSRRCTRTRQETINDQGDTVTAGLPSA